MKPHIRPILLIVGTRPEGIKMAPVYFALKRAGLPVVLCSTMQHNELLTEVFDLFDIQPDYSLNVMRPGQDLSYLTQSILQKTKEIYARVQPSMVLVQGDTTSTLSAALSAFYAGIPVGHVEAGLRTDDPFVPFPEEMNRRAVTTMARYHFAPTEQAVGHLLVNGVSQDAIFLTGNTVVDALHLMKEKLLTGALKPNKALRDRVESCKKQRKKIVLLTAHRREAFDGGIDRILTSMKKFLQKNKDVFCFYPYHPNPHVLRAIERVGLHNLENMYVSEPVGYKDLVYLLLNSHWVLTDSGGIQEEAVSLGKPVLVLRDKTERVEGIQAGIAQLVGTDTKKILAAMRKLLKDDQYEIGDYEDLYGDGYAADKIAAVIQSKINELTHTECKLTKTEGLAPLAQEGSMQKKVCVIGLGYIGLPTAIVTAEHGFDVVGIDIDQDRVNKINDGNPVIHEPEVYEKLQIVLGSGRFRATTQMESADYFMIAVPTPFKESKKADLSYVFAAAENIAPVMAKGSIVILESTVPVGTTKELATFLEEKTKWQEGVDFFVAHCPERVLPGKIFNELIENDRVLGGISKVSVEKVEDFYSHFVRGTIYATDATTAEMVKLIENSSRDAQIAFANQVASMAYSSGLNPYEVIRLANKHPRVNILNPSCGVGGHCIAVDPWFLIQSFPQNSALLQAARKVNDDKPQEVLSCVDRAVKQWQEKNSGTCSVLVLGLTYKPDVDDLRESPALKIARTLDSWEAINLLVAEPHIDKNKLKNMFNGSIVLATEGVVQADIVIYLVGHTRFKAIDQKILMEKTVIDFTGIVYKQQQQAQSEDAVFWPAQSLMDFFVVQKKKPEIVEK